MIDCSRSQIHVVVVVLFSFAYIAINLNTDYNNIKKIACPKLIVIKAFRKFNVAQTKVHSIEGLIGVKTIVPKKKALCGTNHRKFNK